MPAEIGADPHPARRQRSLRSLASALTGRQGHFTACDHVVVGGQRQRQDAPRRKLALMHRHALVDAAIVEHIYVRLDRRLKGRAARSGLAHLEALVVCGFVSVDGPGGAYRGIAAGGRAPDGSS